MKFIILLSIALTSSTALACTDFSGQYLTAVQTYYSISQNSCESMDVIDESGTNQMIFDGVERLLYDYDVVIDDVVMAHISIFLSSEMVGAKWVYSERDVTTYKDGEVEELKKWAEVSFNAESDLLTVLHNADGSSEQFIDIRYKD